MNKTKAALVAGAIAGAAAASAFAAKKKREKSPLEKIIDQLGL